MIIFRHKYDKKKEEREQETNKEKQRGKTYEAHHPRTARRPAKRLTRG